MCVSKSELRRKSQIKLLESGQELQVGDLKDLPLSIEEIKNINQSSKCVVEYFGSGLTAQVYKIKVDSKHYTLKKKREEILVKNIDGQTSFLNEIQRRKDFYTLKREDPEAYKGIVDTVYASLNHGFILSPWIEGTHIKECNKKIYESLFYTLFNMEKAGIFEPDLCSGNLLCDDKDNVILFDFGYTYKYNPLTEFNPDGKENPIFHSAERFESRMFMQYLMELSLERGMEVCLEEYANEKAVAIKYYNKKIQWLEKNKGDKDIIDWVKGFVTLWENGMKNRQSLMDLYELEQYRSYVIDVEDDIGGKSCTVNTIKKIDTLITKVQRDYNFLKQNNGFFWGDEYLSKEKLLEKLNKQKELIYCYQIKY